MKNTNPNILVLGVEEEAIIQTIAEMMGEQIRHAVTDSFIELFSTLWKTRAQNGSQSGAAAWSDEFLKTGEVAAILKISRSQAYQLIQKGELPYYSIGKLVRVKRADLEVFIQEHRVQER